MNQKSIDEQMVIENSCVLQNGELHFTIFVKFGLSLMVSIQMDTTIKQSKKKPQRLVVKVNKLSHDSSERAVRWVEKLRIVTKLELLLWPGISDNVMQLLGMQNVPTMVYVRVLRNIAVEYGILDADGLIDAEWVSLEGDLTSTKTQWVKTITHDVDPVPKKLN